MPRMTFEQIESYLLRINCAKDLDEILRIVQKQVQIFGFDRFTYWLRWPSTETQKPIFISTYPEQFIDHYIANDFQSHDMVGRFSTQTNTPFVWSGINEKYPITQKQKILFDDSRSVGLVSGGSIPIHGPNQIQATFSVVGDLETTEFNKLFLYHRHELHILATYAHERIIQLGIDDSVNDLTLTSRETEILTWVSRGKTYWEIGKILNIQEDTIKKYMQRISALLRVSNNTHAVAKAIINGLIIP